jgi:hypothetical protein
LRVAATASNLLCAIMNNVKQNCAYSLVRAGRFAFTASAVRGEGDITRAAAFRRQRASVNDFLRAPTLPFMNTPEIFTPDEIFGIIVHLPNAFEPKELGFAGIGIPSVDTESWLERPWNLIDLVGAYEARRSDAPPMDDDRAHPREKKDRKKKGDQ